MATVPPPEQAPLVLHGYTWRQYQSIEELFTSLSGGVRVRFLDHQLEIMAPVSEAHEERKSHLGRLVKAWSFHQGIRFAIRGKTTLLRPEEAGGEPDESYCFGEKKDVPDLAFEVALTSGGLSKRAFYAKFAVPELWIWRRDHLEVFVWDAASQNYQPVRESMVLLGLDLSLLEECARMEYASDAVREFQRRCGA
jgi:Uma2 family endonuclease